MYDFFYSPWWTNDKAMTARKKTNGRPDSRDDVGKNSSSSGEETNNSDFELAEFRRWTRFRETDERSVTAE